MGLDKFYTNPRVAHRLIQTYCDKMDVKSDEVFLEPSCGNGAFALDPIIKSRCVAVDVAPEMEGAIRQDFLKTDGVGVPIDHIIGNPPFGKRCRLAVEFINHAATMCGNIGFVLPNTFLKWSTQHLLDERLNLVHSEHLPENSFLKDGKLYDVRCVFQIWTTRSDMGDMRHRTKPPLAYKDFNIWQHNATEQSKKYLYDTSWKYALWRQGYKDYSKVFTRQDYDYLRYVVEDTKLQLFYIEPLNERCEDLVLNHIDFNDLASRNMSTPGFGKSDFIEYYLEKKEEVYGAEDQEA